MGPRAATAAEDACQEADPSQRSRETVGSRGGERRIALATRTPRQDRRQTPRKPQTGPGFPDLPPPVWPEDFSMVVPAYASRADALMPCWSSWLDVGRSAVSGNVREPA